MLINVNAGACSAFQSIAAAAAVSASSSVKSSPIAARKRLAPFPSTPVMTRPSFSLSSSLPLFLSSSLSFPTHPPSLPPSILPSRPPSLSPSLPPSLPPSLSAPSTRQPPRRPPRPKPRVPGHVIAPATYRLDSEFRSPAEKETRSPRTRLASHTQAHTQFHARTHARTRAFIPPPLSSSPSLFPPSVTPKPHPSLDS